MRRQATCRNPANRTREPSAKTTSVDTPATAGARLSALAPQGALFPEETKTRPVVPVRLVQLLALASRSSQAPLPTFRRPSTFWPSADRNIASTCARQASSGCSRKGHGLPHPTTGRQCIHRTQQAHSAAGVQNLDEALDRQMRLPPPRDDRLLVCFDQEAISPSERRNQRVHFRRGPAAPSRPLLMHVASVARNPTGNSPSVGTQRAEPFEAPRASLARRYPTGPSGGARRSARCTDNNNRQLLLRLTPIGARVPSAPVTTCVLERAHHLQRKELPARTGRHDPIRVLLGEELGQFGSASATRLLMDLVARLAAGPLYPVISQTGSWRHIGAVSRASFARQFKGKAVLRVE